MNRLVPVALAIALSSSAFAADIDVVRKNFVDYYTAANADRSSPRMADALRNLENDARAVIAPDFLRADGSWSDINYTETPSGGWSPWEHGKRLWLMARAYQTPGQALHRDPQLLARIDASLGYVEEFYGTKRLPLGNWWFWTMGIPLDLGPTLVLMRGEVSPKNYDAAVNAIALRIGSSPTGRGIVGPVPVGQNLVWSSYTHLCLALTRDDAAMLAAVRDVMATVTLPAIGDGIKPDASFHQHGAQLYTGGYGGAFANDVAKYLVFTRNSSFALPPASLNSFAGYVVDGIAWSLYGNYFDVSVVGREVARRSTTGANGMAALLQVAHFPSARQSEAYAAAAKMLETWHGFPVELAGLAAQIESARLAGSWPAGHRHYPDSDFSIHRRTGWYASIKMHSSRTKSGERTNGENLLGARQSDGRMYLALSGDDYAGRDVWPALDWTRLPGTTVELKADTASGEMGLGTRALAGGTGDGWNGVAAMELAPLGSALTAKKAWFFFDNAIVFLTNSITSTSANPVETIVDQRPLRDPNPVAESNWVLADRVGYLFPSMAGVTTRRETRTGTWAALGGSGDTTPHATTFLTLLVDHKTAPQNARAEYVIVPNTTPDAMRIFAATNPFTIAANDGSVSAVRDRRTSALGIIFWQPATFEGIQAGSPAAIYRVDSPSGMVHLYVSDPTHGTGMLRITLPGRYEVGGAKSTLGALATTIEVPRAGGRTTHVMLSPILTPPRRRSVR